MAVPKRRKSSSKRDMRRSQHDKVTAPNLIPCPNCSAPMVPHRVCPTCGTYRGRQVIAQPAEAVAETTDSAEKSE